MIEEFLHQAGLPLSFVERVAEQMIRTAGEVGLAEEDDPEGLARWQERLLWHSRFLPPNARRALEADETFYYSRTFLRASTSSGSATSEKTAAGIMRRILTEVGVASGRSGWRRVFRIPRLLWRDDELMIEIPARDNQEWKITVDDSEYTYRGAATTETVPVMAGLSLASLPRLVAVTCDDFRREHLLWTDEADNRFQIFKADSQWLKACELGADSVSLPPGTYSSLLRFEPSGLNKTAVKSVTSQLSSCCRSRLIPAKNIDSVGVLLRRAFGRGGRRGYDSKAKGSLLMVAKKSFTVIKFA